MVKIKFNYVQVLYYISKYYNYIHTYFDIIYIENTNSMLRNYIN